MKIIYVHNFPHHNLVSMNKKINTKEKLKYFHLNAKFILRCYLDKSRSPTHQNKSIQ